MGGRVGLVGGEGGVGGTGDAGVLGGSMEEGLLTGGAEVTGGAALGAGRWVKGWDVGR